MSSYKLAAWYYSSISHNKRMRIIIGFIIFFTIKRCLYFLFVYNSNPKNAIMWDQCRYTFHLITRVNKLRLFRYFQQTNFNGFFDKLNLQLFSKTTLYFNLLLFSICFEQQLQLLNDIGFQSWRLISIFGSQNILLPI